jgi:acyl-CoA synthetase (AMP-forming)/AMP-acid ligase II
MGTSYRPRQVLLVSDLPKTRNMKIMRRVVRAVYKGRKSGRPVVAGQPGGGDRVAGQDRRLNN